MGESLVGELLEVLAKWNEVVVFEKYEWNGKELNLLVRVKEATKPKGDNNATNKTRNL